MANSVVPADTPTVSIDPVRHIEASMVGDYVVERELGRGGMGVVYLARDVRLDRPVAIKFLLTDFGLPPSARERFVREARTAANLSHPHIVPVYRIIEEPGVLCIVTAYIDGETLAQRISSRGPLESREAASILREIAWALGYAHARGIVHRDVKPENILLERGSGRSFLADFGIARDLNATSLTASGAIVGSVHYMSPELAFSNTIDGRSDLYALGVVGYYAVTGVRPIDGPSGPAILVNHLNVTPRPVLTLNNDVSVTLATAIERCLAKQPDQRFENAEAFADAMAPVVGQRVEIPPLLRGWITRGEITMPVLALWMLPVVAMPNAELSSMADATWGPPLIQRLLAVIIGVVPAGTVAFLVRLRDLRQMSKAGFTLQDVRFGTLAYAMQRSEELSAQRRRSSGTERFLRAIAIGVASFVGMVTMYTLVTMRVHSTFLGVGAVLTAMLAFTYAVVASGLWNRVRHFRSVMWNSSVGEAVFRLARPKGPTRSD